MQIIIKPLPSEKWHGKNGKESFSRPASLEVLYDSETGRYATGLTEEERAKYEKITGLDLSDNFNPTEPHPFWGSNAAKIKLPNHTMILDDTRPLDFIKIKNLKASKYVANSVKEHEEGLWPDATHVIFDEQEEVQLVASKLQRKNKARAATLTMSLDEKTNLVRLLSDKTINGRSQDFIDVELDNIIENQIDDFAKFYKMDKTEVTTRAKIMEALSKNILTKEGSSIFYMGDKLGHDFEQVVAYFTDPDNQMIKVAILEKLEK